MRVRFNRLFHRRARRIFAGCLLAGLGAAYVFWQHVQAPTQLWMAVASRDTSRVRLFLNCGVDVNAQFDPDYLFLLGDQDGQDRYGKSYTRRYWTPLATAASAGDIRIVRLLLSRGADVKEKGLGFCGEGGDSFELETPLHWAATQGYPDIVLLLLQRGADVNSVKISDVTAEDSVLLPQWLSVIQILKRAGNKAGH